MNKDKSEVKRKWIIVHYVIKKLKSCLPQQADLKLMSSSITNSYISNAYKLKIVKS